MNSFNPKLQLKDAEFAIKNELLDLLTELKVITLVLAFKKIQSRDKTTYRTFYSNAKAKTIINESEIDDVFKSVYSTVKSNI